MKYLLMLPLFVLFFLPNTQAQKWWNGGVDGSGPRVEKDLQLDQFSGIRLSINADVYLTQGSTQSVRISAQQNIIDLIETNVDGSIWKIKTEENIDDHAPIKIYITVPRMTYVKLSGSGDIYTENTFTGNDAVEVGISGSGDLRFKTTANSIEAAISGSGDIELDGSTENLNISISGSGDIDAKELVSGNCEVRISGSGGAKVHATKNLNVRVSGSGDVYYKGSPNVQSRVSGSGDLQSISGR
ncbi:head GIN domain-containing protein [Lewinella cohaerens]|uniref:head GIN domain-containing protein n=1 Tax=Lewinella cohaerens TaxID=70995 RepID=UPI000371CB21|nr:head GIN domain-containing protein [Lewinella cohaerens]